jgi:hypothetical protein
MPYIPYSQRLVVQQTGPQKAGDLNYQLTLCVLGYLKAHGTSYQTINDCVGALEGAKLEFVRRVVNKYEDSAIQRNGDIYEVQP